MRKRPVRKARTFAYAGFPSLVMPLWKIDEKVSSEIITRFYRHLAKGMPKHEALRQAKLDHLADAQDELALPYYWAGMVLVGDVAPVEVVDRGWCGGGAGMVAEKAVGITPVIFPFSTVNGRKGRE